MTTTMPKLADAIAAHTLPKGPSCTIGRLLAQLPAASRKDLAHALADPFVPGTAIARGLAAIGHKLSPYVIQRHRRRECGCQ